MNISVKKILLWKRAFRQAALRIYSLVEPGLGMREIRQRIGSSPTTPMASIDLQPDRPLSRHPRISPFQDSRRLSPILFYLDGGKDTKVFMW